MSINTSLNINRLHLVVDFGHFLFLTCGKSGDILYIRDLKNTRPASAGFGLHAHPGGFLYLRGLSWNT